MIPSLISRDFFASRPFVIAGPCVIESLDQCLHIARTLQSVCARLGAPLVFKASFDKANRSSGGSFRGPGIEDGLVVLDSVRSATGLPILSDVHEPRHAVEAGAVLDILQIPAFLARQTDLLQAAGRTGRVVNIKKGQFMAPGEMNNAVEKVRLARLESGVDEQTPTLVTERGTFFGYGRLVNDFAGLPELRASGCPTVFDITHSTQRPAALGHASGGDPSLSPLLARAAVAAGFDGLFLECHPDPRNAKSDAASVLPLEAVEPLLTQCVAIARAVQRVTPPR